ncbi:hypothetical protein CCY16_00708 [Wolbachia endosymbiont of Wuchereria bancrofti]|nr:hypothetical protein CCY16_00708 [Wolbachia endosymbiont of Wuchereria bancrofti]
MTCTGDFVSFCPRPEGFGALVYTATTSFFDFNSEFSALIANSGDPIKMTLMLLNAFA